MCHRDEVSPIVWKKIIKAIFVQECDAAMMTKAAVLARTIIYILSGPLS